jgi:5-methylcytosine-specific restriction endonuclease McrA
VQFTATQEYVDLVERAQALLGQSANEKLSELHLQAMQALVAQLEKRKYAASDTSLASSASCSARRIARGSNGGADDVNGEAGGRRGAEPVQDKAPRQRGQRSRYIPAPVRHEVFRRDGQRCTYVDEDTGQRCRETRRLQFHHIDPFARGGGHSAD